MKRLLVAVICVFIAGAAGAQTQGLFMEKSTFTDDVTVRRIRDTEEGVLCYIAIGHTDSVPGVSGMFHGKNPAISCVRAR